MISLSKIQEHLQQSLSPNRYIHSRSTAETAKKLADRYGQDSNKAYLAGLVHDCCRELDMDKQHSMLKALSYEVDELTFSIKELLHAYTAEYILRNTFIIEDKEIIMAVRSHTTGKEAMSKLEKIIFLSDVIEPSRSFPGIEYLRRLSMESLDEAVLAAFDSSIKFLIGKYSLIHPDTFLARNYIIKHLQK